jgi:succinate dehydrogenase/fumarate reductase flavoprotein subunit
VGAKIGGLWRQAFVIKQANRALTSCQDNNFTNTPNQCGYQKGLKDFALLKSRTQTGTASVL